MESYHAGLRRRIQVCHPNMFTFLGHLQRSTKDSLHDQARLARGLNVKRPKRKVNMANESRIQSCIARFDAGSHSRLQFLRAVSHSVGSHTDALHSSNSSTTDGDSDDNDQPSVPATNGVPQPTNSTMPSDGCEICLIARRSGIALVPCGHARFCCDCVDRLLSMGSGCPVCRANIDMVLRVFQ